ncbi:MAG TPA: PAS domain-containing protein, partial [Polyangiales bacterium]
MAFVRTSLAAAGLGVLVLLAIGFVQRGAHDSALPWLGFALPLPLAALGVARARDRRLRAAARIRETSERYELAAEGSGDGLFDWDLLQERCYFSPSFAALLGYETLGDGVDEWFARVHPDDLPQLRTALTVQREAPDARV